MPPTADTRSDGLRTSVSLLPPYRGPLDKTMRTVSMMSGDTPNNQNGFLPRDISPDKHNSLKFDFFFKEPCLYSHKVYLNSAKVFNSLRQQTKEELENPYIQRRKAENETNGPVMLPDLDFEDDTEKRLTFELAFETLKYQKVFEDLLQECAFFIHFPECQEDLALVMVMLWDYQNRKFQMRTPLPNEVLDPVVTSVEEAIQEYKTKLNASLARHRIKAAAPSLEFLLPEKVRSNEEIRSKLPVYVWVNQQRTSLETVISLFKDDCYTLVDCDHPLEGQVFYVDFHCPDMLVFPADSRDFITEHDLLQGGSIVMQDKSSCIAPQTVKYLIGDDDDVIHVNAGSCVTTAHISSLMHSSTGNILAFGAQKAQALQATLDKYSAKNIKIQSESFLDIEPEDNKYKNVKVVLVTTDCSKSAISNPVDFIVNEGEDMKILKYLSLGQTDDSKLGEMIGNHGAILRQAMKLTRIQAVVYMTRSVIDAENENVVTRAVEQINLTQHRKFPFRVVPPVLPFSGHDIEKSNGINGKFVKFKPSEKHSGCFVAVITREPDDIRDSSKDVLERAKAKGLLGGKKKAKKVDTEVTENGDAEDGEEDVEKLLDRRSKRAPRKLQSGGNKPIPVYSRPSYSIVKSKVFSASSAKSIQRGTKSTGAIVSHAKLMERLKPLAEPSLKKDKKPPVSEHVKVVKHPAPFRKKVTKVKNSKMSIASDGSTVSSKDVPSKKKKTSKHVPAHETPVVYKFKYIHV